MMNLKTPYSTYNLVLLHQENLNHNLELIVKLSHGKKVIPVLKSNAYGHGLVEIAKMLEQTSITYDRVAVDGYFEALELLKQTRLKMLVMGPIDPINIPSIKRDRIAFVVHDLSYLEAICQLKKNITIHLEFDTGMKRHGLNVESVDVVIQLIQANPKVNVEGVMTHLADADNPESDKFVDAQYKKFEEIIDQMSESGINPKLVHVQQSAGVTRNQFSKANAVRPGIAIYGISPLDSSDPQAKVYQDLQPVLEFRSKISCLQSLDKHETVSYSRTYQAKDNEQIAVVPVGYYECLPRSLSNVGALTDKDGNELPVRGRICMNHTMVDATNKDKHVLDEIVVISPDKTKINSLESICKLSGSFNYEVLVNIAPTTRRMIV